jgi:hypothetical protein
MYYTLNTNAVQPVGSETCASWTAALKVSNSKCIVRDGLKKELLLSTERGKVLTSAVAVQREVTAFDIYEK